MRETKDDHLLVVRESKGQTVYSYDRLCKVMKSPPAINPPRRTVYPPSGVSRTHCPQCGQQQVSEVVRFCSKCGFPLDGVIQLLANGGVLPVYQPTEGTKGMSPGKKGVRQGAILLLTGAVLVLIVVFHGPSTPDILLFLAGSLCSVSGQMLYAALFEEGAATRQIPAARPYVPPSMPAQFGTRGRGSALPPSVNGWKPRVNTAELVQPPSVTENTTQLLDEKAEPKDQ